MHVRVSSSHKHLSPRSPKVRQNRIPVRSYGKRPSCRTFFSGGMISSSTSSLRIAWVLPPPTAPVAAAAEATQAPAAEEREAETAKAEETTAKPIAGGSDGGIDQSAGVSALGEGTCGKQSQAQNQAQNGRNRDFAHVYHRSSFLS